MFVIAPFANQLIKTLATGRTWPLVCVFDFVYDKCCLIMGCQLKAKTVQHGIPVHMDGARIMNAAVASGLSLKEVCKDVDSISVCFSKVSSNFLCCEFCALQPTFYLRHYQTNAQQSTLWRHHIKAVLTHLPSPYCELEPNFSLNPTLKTQVHG